MNKHPFIDEDAQGHYVSHVRTCHKILLTPPYENLNLLLDLTLRLNGVLGFWGFGNEQMIKFESGN